jgi:uncharacterized protein involved in outer membrane biogenesis
VGVSINDSPPPPAPPTKGGEALELVTDFRRAVPVLLTMQVDLCPRRGSAKMRFDKDQKPAKLYLLFLVGITLVLFLYTVVGFWILPPIVKHLLEKNLSEQLHRRVTIDTIRINPYELSFSIKGFSVREANSPEKFLAFQELYAVVQGGSIIERALILREVSLTGPYVNISRSADNRFNFSDLLEPQKPVPESSSGAPAGPDAESAAVPPSKKSDSKADQARIFRFSIHNVQIIDGTMDYTDEAKGEVESLDNIQLNLPLISSLGDSQDGWMDLTVAARINESPLTVVAKAKPFSDPLESVVDVQLKDFDLSDYSAYLPPQLQFKVRSGKVDAQATVAYSQVEDGSSLKVAGEGAIKSFEVVDMHDSRLINLPRMEISVESLEPLAGKLHLSKVMIQSPEIDLWRNKDGKLNVQMLVAGSDTARPAPAPSTKEPPFLVQVDDVEITNGRVGFTDHAAPSDFKTSLEAIDLRISQFKNTPGSRTAIKLGARTEGNETLEIQGSMALDPVFYEGQVAVSGITPAKYAPYYQQQVLFDVIDGKLDLKTFLHIKPEARDLDLKLSDLMLSVTSLKLRKRGDAANFLEIPSLKVKESTLDLARKEVTLGELLSENGKISSGREKNGQLYTQTLLPAAPDLGTGKYLAEGVTKAEQDQWKFLLRKAALKDYTVSFEDRKLSEPATFLIDHVNLEGENLSVEKDSKSKIALSCRVNEGGTFRVEGDLNITPVFADLKLNLKDIEITPVQQYLPEDIKVKLMGGKLSVTGNLLLNTTKEDNLNASYAGDLVLSDFSSIDTIRGEGLSSWKNLSAKVVDAGNNPPRANIRLIGISDFFTRVAISPEGQINLLQVLGSSVEPEPGPVVDREKGLRAERKTGKKPEATPTAKSAASREKPQPAVPQKKGVQPAAIKIDQISLQGGKIAFSDNLIKPNFHAELLDIRGTVAGLSSEKDRFADVNLRGKLYRSSPLEITGKIGPFADNLFVDLSVNFKNIDLTRWNPYAQKYVGYTVEKGNLHLELKYLIAQKKLDSQNNIVFDRLTLGEKVDSPDATTLPVKFAISLLQDRNGEIQLGIPVSGDLNDPKFSLGSIIMNAVKNLILKAVTAPFALLGALLPQGVGEINHVDMDYTTGKMTDTGVKNLDALAKILHDRPNLELDIQGCLETNKGKEILTQDLFDKKLKTQKLKEMMKQGAAGVSIDQVTVSQDETQKYLKMAYDDEFSKGLLKSVFSKTSPPEEMKTQLLAKIQVTDEEVKSLAYDWALKVKEYLLESGKVEPRRLFVLEPTIVSPAAKTESAGNGVNLKLK